VLTGHASAPTSAGSSDASGGVGIPHEEAPVRSPAITAVVDFLGLSEMVEPTSGDLVAFRLGVLYPYSRDLQRVCTRFEVASQQYPDAVSLLLGQTTRAVPALSLEQFDVIASYLESIATLYNRIAFAPGPAGGSVGSAHKKVQDALAHATRPSTAGAGAP
jgi:hypothetical protein